MMYYVDIIHQHYTSCWKPWKTCTFTSLSHYVVISFARWSYSKLFFNLFFYYIRTILSLRSLLRRLEHRATYWRTCKCCVTYLLTITGVIAGVIVGVIIGVIAGVIDWAWSHSLQCKNSAIFKFRNQTPFWYMNSDFKPNLFLATF